MAARKAYRLVLVIPDKMSREKVFHLRALGAEVVMTRSDVGRGHPQYYQDLAERITAKRRAHSTSINSTTRPIPAHETTTGPEIWEQTGHDLDAVICGVGSGGTITGLSRYFAEQAPQVEMVLADPAGSVLAEFIRTGFIGEAGSWVVEGIGEDFIPPIVDLSRVPQRVHDHRPRKLDHGARSLAQARAFWPDPVRERSWPPPFNTAAHRPNRSAS